MRKSIHQGYEVLDVFNLKNNTSIKLAIKDKLQSLFGKVFPCIHYGNIESIINKESIIVHIDINTYKVSVDKKYTILNTYTDDVVANGSEIIWLHKSEIKNETRLREGDKKILERVFHNKSIHIKIIEDQGERWIDAKTILYEDK
jgi:hypothetical protein